MTAPQRRMLLPLAFTLLLAAVLLRFPPTQYHFYPQCPLFVLTGLQCPGCGATRALAALLRGHLAEAFHQNALVVASAPFLLGYAAFRWLRFSAEGASHTSLGRRPRDKMTKRSRGLKVRHNAQTIPNRLVAASLVAAAVFTVLRNLHPER